ncbi:MAG: 6-phosphogluconolactonase [Leptospirillia bacterium]
MNTISGGVSGNAGITLLRFPTKTDWTRRGADAILARLDDHLARQRTVSVALSGGSTPAPVFREMAARLSSEWSEKKRERILWFFVDERCVPPGDPQSNYRMAKETLFAPANIEDRCIFRMEGEHPHADIEALRYERLLTDILGPAVPHSPVIDILLLGMGPDGHTASLFPGTSPEDDRHRLVIPVPPTGDRVARITLTYRMLAGGGERIFLVCGQEKRSILEKVLSPDGDLPTQWLLREASGHGHPTTFLLDPEAAPGDLLS